MNAAKLTVVNEKLVTAQPSKHKISVQIKIINQL